MSINYIFTFSCLIMSTFSCNPFSTKSNIQWPEEWSKDMHLSLFSYGGMTPESWNIYISADSSYYEKNLPENKTKYSVSIDKKELKELMKVLMENKIDRIKTYESKDLIYDMPTSGFSFQYGNKECNISPGATTRIDEKWQQNFRNIYDYANELVLKKLDLQKRPFTFVLDESVIKSNKELHGSVEFSEASFNFHQDSIPGTIPTMLLPGKYKVQIHLINPDKRYSSSYEMYYSSLYLTVDTESSHQTTLFLNGKELITK